MQRAVASRRVEDDEGFVAAARRAVRPTRAAEARPTPAARSMESAEADLQEFAARLRDQFAYLEWRGIDRDAALETAREEIEIPFPQRDLHLRSVEFLPELGEMLDRARAPPFNPAQNISADTVFGNDRRRI